MFKNRKNKLMTVFAMIIFSMSAWQARGMGGLNRDEIERKIQSSKGLEKKIKTAIQYDFVNEYRGNNNDTLLHRACSNNNLNMVRLLLDRGAIESVNSSDSKLSRPLHWACFNDNLEMVRLLLENGAIESVKKKGKYKETPDKLTNNEDILNLLNLVLQMQASHDKVMFIKNVRLANKEDFEFLVKVLRGDLLVQLAKPEAREKEKLVIEQADFNALIKGHRLTEEEKKDLERILYLEKTLGFKIDELNLYDYICQYAKGRLPEVYKAMQRLQLKEHIIERCIDCDVVV